ncbi:alpha/beta hydrolase [Jiulongibacter sediminis]|uniref:BD-FAE-like domain-containing protein n=1 Tax=Jiulongibacter sediminis TaxID=1605367 RepID=A0A0N8HAF7_9BACT|nr:alpha/beta hydrolase [Jiulongibacter sediminis]KPM50044.1 hypothetical protein AFM12_05730 [Jiulongibacter sediminis]TBX27070.1 hypothetical protein TK44_05735 [Jiulongibacter sediminis]
MKSKYVFLLLLFIIGNRSVKGQFEYNNLSYVVEDIPVDSLQMLNLVLPESVKNAPLLIWIGGGAWSYGDRHVEMKLARNLAKQGIAVASVGHRLSPAVWRDPSLSKGVIHPAHIEDVARAVKWLSDHAQEYGYDGDKFFIGGYSSGAHLASLLSLDSQYLEKYDLNPSIFKGILPFSGTFDIPHYREILRNGARPELAEQHVDAVFGSDSLIQVSASPMTYLKNLSSPILILSDNDLHRYTRHFEDALRQTDFRKVEVIYTFEFGHGALWRNLSGEEESPHRNRMVSFIKENAMRPKG